MKFTIEFEDKEEALETLKAVDLARAYQIATEDFARRLRNIAKHEDHHEEAVKILQIVREEFYNYYRAILPD